jgi:hypothetical protein
MEESVCEEFRRLYEDTLSQIRNTEGVPDDALLSMAKKLGAHRKSCQACDQWAKKRFDPKLPNPKKKQK